MDQPQAAGNEVDPGAGLAPEQNLAPPQVFQAGLRGTIPLDPIQENYEMINDTLYESTQAIDQGEQNNAEYKKEPHLKKKYSSRCETFL